MSTKGGSRGSKNKRQHKKGLYKLQGGRCACCGKFRPKLMFGAVNGENNRLDIPTLDHVIRLRDGGNWARVNLQLVHLKCNIIRN